MIDLTKEKLDELSAKIERIQMPGENKNSLSQKIYRILLCLLIDGTIPPGSLLNRRDLADSLGVSVAPVLEALIQLEHEGYVTSISRKGTIVNSYTTDDIIDNLLLREAFECEAARFYCGEPVRKHMDELMPLAIAADSDSLDMENQNWVNELLFHRALMSLAETPSLLRQFTNTCQLNAFYSAFTRRATGDDLVFDLHQNMLAKLAESDPDQAEALLRYHIRTTINAVLKTHTSNHLHSLKDFEIPENETGSAD